MKTYQASSTRFIGRGTWDKKLEFWELFTVWCWMVATRLRTASCVYQLVLHKRKARGTATHSKQRATPIPA
jgi:hypothetical protein